MPSDADKLEYIRYLCYRTLGDSCYITDDTEVYHKILKLLGPSERAKAESKKQYWPLGENHGEEEPEVYRYETWRHLLETK